MRDVALLSGDCRSVLLRLPAGSVQVCVTSPPYYGLRKYEGVEPATWGGDPACVHEWGTLERGKRKDMLPADETESTGRSGKDEKQNGASHDGGRRCTRCTAWHGFLGNEPTPEQYIANIVECFRAVHRVLRDDGLCWIVLGDSYARAEGKGVKYKGGDGAVQHRQTAQGNRGPDVPAGRNAGDLLMIPHLVALALQADGWIVRSLPIWAKGVSAQGDMTARVEAAARDIGLPEEVTKELVEAFDPYVGNCMPESQAGWSWRRHRRKITGGLRGLEPQRIGATPERPQQDHDGHAFRSSSTYEDCPGCPKCTPNDGRVLQRGSWRPTASYEVVLMLAKQQGYFTDPERVKEVAVYGDHPRSVRGLIKASETPGQPPHRGLRPGVKANGAAESLQAGRNLRAVWALPPQPSRLKHYATFPERLVEICLKVSTPSGGVCSSCGAPWAPVVESTPMVFAPSARHFELVATHVGSVATTLRGTQIAPARAATVGHRATCTCATSARPAIVLDPFSGSGTTGLVARRLGLWFCGVDASAKYVEMAQARFTGGTA